MTGALMPTTMSTGLQKIAERAQREPGAKFHSLAHLIDEKLLRRSFDRLRKNAAIGVDGVTKEQYGQELEKNLQELHERMKARKYRHQPIRRVHIPKGNGKNRPIGVSAIEDKVVQTALREVLEAIYERDFLNCSYGFRPGRSAHDATRALVRGMKAKEAKFILEIDIASFFDRLDRAQLVEMLRKRVADGSMLRLIGKCLHVGVLDGEELSNPDEGTVQGSTLSPLLGNIYLHYVLDEWFTEQVKPRLRGKAFLVRYADDALFGFERQDDAERVQMVLEKRLAKFGLTLHPDKTRLLDFRRPSNRHDGRKGRSTFEFLGFRWYWWKTHRDWWSTGCSTRRASRTRVIQAVYDWCRDHRHLSIKEQQAALVRRIQGHYNYFGVGGNLRSLQAVDWHVRRAWYKWLNRRSQRARLTWERFVDLLRGYPLPVPRVVVGIWR